MCADLGLETSPQFGDKVTEIDLSNNKLNIFPNRSRLPYRLRYLDVSGNPIQGISSDSLRNLSQLEHLDLSRCESEFSETILTGDTFKDLKNLRYLDIKYPHKSGAYYPEKALLELSSLETLRLSGKSRGFSSVFSKLTKLQKLDTSGNGGFCDFDVLPVDFFKNISQISILDISKCNLKNLLLGTFSGLRRLQDLNISQNEELSFSIMENLTEDLTSTKIERLRIQKIHCTFGVGTQLFRHDMNHLKYTKLKELYLDHNRLELVESGVLANLPKTLKYIKVSSNRLTFGWYALEVWFLTNIRTIDMSDQFLSSNPSDLFPLCDDTRNKRRSNCSITISEHIGDKNPVLLSHLQIDINFSLPEHLENVFFNKCRLVYYHIRTLNPGRNQIKRIYAQDNSLYEWIGPIYGAYLVEYVDLSNNFCQNISTSFFDTFTNLKVLKINKNILGFSLQADSEGLSFKNLRNLTYLDISSNRILHLPRLIFKSMSSLHFLNLRNNLLTYFSIKINHMEDLKHLDLAYNHLTELESDTMNHFNRKSTQRKITVDLTGNPIRCECENIEFVRWIVSTKVKVKFDFCVSKYDNTGKVYKQNFRDFVPHLEKYCRSYTAVLVISAAFIVLFVTVIICAIIYRYRWKIRYLFYMAKNNYFGYKQMQEANETDYEYDAFISYADEDRWFAFHTIREKIEEGTDLRLCFHNRDFLPGLEIAENITNAVHSSRKTICVISNNYLKSYWCIYEINIARMESIYSRNNENVLFLVLFENNIVHHLPMTIMDLIGQQTYIEYPNDPLGDVVFWENLRKAIERDN